ncbi:MAG: hypothetical protein ABSG55_04550 [Dehalococcoidia bacterium]
MPDVADFLFDDESETKMAAHGLTPSRVLQVLDNVHVIVPNRRGRRAPFLIVGRDNGGACISTPIEPTRDPLVWRPITAWPSKESERRQLERRQ